MRGASNAKNRTAFWATGESRAEMRAQLLTYLEAGRNRWTPHRKAAVVTGIRAKIINADEMHQRFGIDAAELGVWDQDFNTAGIDGLKVTRIQNLVRRYA